MKELNIANFLEERNKKLYESPEVRRELMKKNASRLSISASSNSVLGASSIMQRRGINLGNTLGDKPSRMTCGSKMFNLGTQKFNGTPSNRSLLKLPSLTMQNSTPTQATSNNEAARKFEQ